ncbi:MAG TPA: penicillin-binding transpeptidase domain-containing protein [Thermomicrobiales bacterium]|nr:penicillin-binding transpeptidase domain-containing protein [Thermomicrobiales bacterium]
MRADDGLGGGVGGGLLRFGAFLATAGILALGLLARGDGADRRWLLALAASAPFLALLLWPRLPRDLPTFNRTVVRLGTLLVVAFLLTSIHLVRLQIVRADALAHQSGTAANGDVVANPRLFDERLREQRGEIIDRNGKVIAGTSLTPRGYTVREYPSPSSYIAGYYSPQLYGLSGIEQAEDAYLSGTEGENPFVILQRQLLHRPTVGNNVQLTLDLRLQEVADQALAGRAGAVVALDPRTGAVLALASAPHVDPQQLALDPRKDFNQEVARANAYWAAITGPQGGNPLLLRPTQGLYVPGSIFKTLTAAAALDAGTTSPDRVYPDPGDIVIDGHRIVEENRPQPVRDQYTLTEGYKWSLNIVFAQVGLGLGTVQMEQYTKAFGFGQPIPFELPTAASRVSTDPNFLASKPALADTGFGQGQLEVTPLEMALITATMVDDGKMPRPYVVGAIRAPDGHVLQQTKPKTWLTPIRPETAAQVRQLMITSVEQGYANAGHIDGLVIGGKTGTAETNGDPHSWYICFAGKPNQPPELVVAVIVEHGGPGSRVALPIANQVVKAYFGQ